MSLSARIQFFFTVDLALDIAEILLQVLIQILVSGINTNALRQILDTFSFVLNYHFLFDMFLYMCLRIHKIWLCILRRPLWYLNGSFAVFCMY